VGGIIGRNTFMEDHTAGLSVERRCWREFVVYGGGGEGGEERVKVG